MPFFRHRAMRSPCARPSARRNACQRAAKKPEPVPGGVAFDGEMRTCYRANLESRLATRVLLRLGRAPYRDEQDVYEAAFALKWPEWFGETQSIRVDVNA